MRKYLRKFQIVILMTIGFLSCEKEDLTFKEDNVTKEENFSKNSLLKEVTHLYEYQGDIFEVTYVFNIETNEVINVKGDIDKAEQILGKDTNDLALLYVYEGVDDPDYVEMKIFDTREELLKETRSNIKDSIYLKNQKNDCYDIDSYGPADYIFYDDINQGGNILVQGNGKEEYSL